MSDETGIPEEGQAAPTQDWEKDYKALQAEYTRSQQTLKSFDDPNALISFIQEKHPDLLTEDEEEEPEDLYEPEEQEAPLTRAEFKQWQAEQAQAEQARAAQNQFETDFKKFVGDRELDPQGDAFIRYAATKGDIKGPDDLKKTVDDWFTYIDGKTVKARPRAPHVPANGQAATEVPDWSGMSRAERDRYMAERAMGQLNQS